MKSEFRKKFIEKLPRLVWCFFSTWGRVWVHHLRLSSGHCQNSDGQWLSCPIPWSIKTVNSVYPEFIMIHSFVFIYICLQIGKTLSATTGTVIRGGGHHPSLFPRWPELKLRWWTQTLPRLYRIHLVCCWFWWPFLSWTTFAGFRVGISYWCHVKAVLFTTASTRKNICCIR